MWFSTPYSLLWLNTVTMKYLLHVKYTALYVGIVFLYLFSEQIIFLNQD